MEINVQKQNAALQAGKKVADNIIGYTTDKEQKQIIEFTKSIDAESVKSFLSGYKAQQLGTIFNRFISLYDLKKPISILNIGNNPVQFFTQLNDEYNFPEKDSVLRDVATKLAEYLENNGRQDEAKQLRTLLEREKIYPAEMDKIATKVIDCNY